MMNTGFRLHNVLCCLVVLFLFSANGCDTTTPQSRDTTITQEDTAPGDAPSQDTQPSPDVSTPETTDTPDTTPPSSTFSSGPYGQVFRDLAGPFIVNTDAGVLSFDAESWTGEDAWIFVLYTNDTRQSPDLLNAIESIWYPGGSAAQEIIALLETSPRNTHYVFASFDQDADTDMARFRTDVDAALDTLSDEDATWWRERLHIVTEPAWQTEDWYGNFMRDRGLLWFGVDPFQRVRQLGVPQMLSGTGQSTPGLRNFAFEAQYFAFELERHNMLQQHTWTTVPVFTEQRVSREFVDIELPDAATLTQYDTLFIDLGAYCPEHMDNNCGEWDRLSHLYVCDVPAVPDNPHTTTPCQSAVAAVEEVMGQCENTTDPCTSDTDCTSPATCMGYAAPVAEVPADTLPCDCIAPNADTEAATYTCNADGTGYDACGCGCGTELARWITTYGREGRWITDISPMLALLARGGQQRLRMVSGNAYDMDLSLLLTNQGSGLSASEYVPLFSGGRFDENYNTDRDPVSFTVPGDVKKVELVTLITGHGWGAEVENCAEFCNHTHHFELNGGRRFVKTHPEAGTIYGCRDQISDGVVPLQYGTWPLGRGGWCPGHDVVPWRVDITNYLAEGENSMGYFGLFNNATYQPQPSGSGQGFGARINMASYLVYWR